MTPADDHVIAETNAESGNDDGALSSANTRLMRIASVASVCVAVVLIVAKLGAWAMTESVSLLSTLMDSVLDVLASLVNLFAIYHATQPADREHRFGHGKAEPLAGLAQAAFICGSGLFLLIEAGDRILHPRAVINPEVGYAVMVFSIVLTVLLVAFQKFVVRRTGSVAIDADSLHYQTDVMINASVILSLYVAAELGWRHADPMFAVAIAGYIVWGAWGIGLKALDILMDRELPDEDRQRIREIVMAHPEVTGIHDIRTRSSGLHVFIQFHLEMDGDMRLMQAHEISDTVEAEIMDAFPNAEVIIHEDPEGIEEDHAVYR